MGEDMKEFPLSTLRYEKGWDVGQGGLDGRRLEGVSALGCESHRNMG